MATLRLLSRSSGLKLNNISDGISRPLPSAGGSEGINTAIHHDASGSRKRKRSDDHDSSSLEQLDEPRIRKLHKQHKIRITDLHTLHNAHDSESRKSHKETSRLFPQPLRSFSDLHPLDVHKALVSNLVQQAYTEPTEVQLATIPLLLRRARDEPDLLTVAPTGSGKTLAFLIPLIDKIAKSRYAQTTTRSVSSLILGPTKELVGQIVNEGKKLTPGTGVRIAEMRKGMSLQDISEAHQNSPNGDESEATAVKSDIIVATPLSLLNAIVKGTNGAPRQLPFIQNLILDEADYLLDPLFRDQVMSVWSACTSPELRVSLWSATIGSSIEELALSTIASRYPKSSKEWPPLLRTVIGLKDTSLPTISHRLVYASTEPGKLMGLRQILHPAPSTTKSPGVTTPALRPPFMIFTQTIPRATALHEELKYDIPAAAGGSTRIAVLHSDLSSTQRSKTMTEFRQGKIWILITTDLLSRGIDFRGINGVVNYDIPTTAASYVHRAGRTGRAGRQGGTCITFYTRDDIKYLKPIVNLISASEGESSNDANLDQKHNGAPSWLLEALPSLSKQDRKDLKERGVDVRRAVKESDDKEERRKKGKNRIGTSSGYERKSQDRKRGMIEGSKRRKRKEVLQEDDQEQEDGFDGFDD